MPDLSIDLSIPGSPNSSSTASSEDTIRDPRNGNEFKHGNQNPPINSENELEEMVRTFEDQSAKLEMAFQEIKATTNHFLSIDTETLEFRNPKKWQRPEIRTQNFAHLNKLLESSIDNLRQYLWPGKVDGQGNGLVEGAGSQDIDSSDLNKKLFIICCEGYTMLIEEEGRLMSVVGEEIETIRTPLPNGVDLTEELHRFLNWGSYTGIKEGQLALLINHSMYKDIRNVLERITVTLIKLCEEYFIKDPRFTTNSLVLGGTRLTPWREQAKEFLEGLLDKSFSAEMYFSSSVSLNEDVSTPVEDEDGEGGKGSPTSESSQNSHHEILAQRELQDQTNALSPHSDSSDSADFLPQGLPIDHLLEQLRDCNDILSSGLSVCLEMIKASFGKGTHLDLYRAVRKTQHSEVSLPLDRHYPLYQHDSEGSDRKNVTTTLPIPSPPKGRRRPEICKDELKPRYARPEPQIRSPDVIKKTETQNDPRAILWDHIQAAALTNPEALPSLFSSLEDIGFGLYCRRNSVLLEKLDLDKWAELEVLRAMWKNASQHTRDSFRELSKKTLPELKSPSLNPQSSNSNPREQHNNSGGSNNARQQPPLGLGVDDFVHAPSNRTQVSGRYTTIYYPDPQTTENLPNETYEATVQASSLRRPVRPDPSQEIVSRPRRNQPRIAAEAYNSTGSVAERQYSRYSGFSNLPYEFSSRTNRSPPSKPQEYSRPRSSFKQYAASSVQPVSGGKPDSPQTQHSEPGTPSYYYVGDRDRSRRTDPDTKNISDYVRVAMSQPKDQRQKSSQQAGERESEYPSPKAENEPTFNTGIEYPRPGDPIIYPISSTEYYGPPLFHRIHTPPLSVPLAPPPRKSPQPPVGLQAGYPIVTPQINDKVKEQ